MITTRVSTRGRITVPRAVCERLGVKPGDRLRFREVGRAVLIEKDEGPVDETFDPLGDPFAAFTEWASPEDEEAWKDL